MKLLDWRRENKRTQVWLSEATGIPQPLLSRYERGVTTPKVENVRRIAQATAGCVTLDDWCSKERGS